MVQSAQNWHECATAARTTIHRDGTPSQELLVIRRNRQTEDVSLDPLRWGLMPYWSNDPTGGRKPINAKCETVRDLPFRDAYRKRRCIVPVDGLCEGGHTSQARHPL
jgi:putative SOS response-associated peptidase YedK